MKKTLQVFAWTQVVLGALSLIGWAGDTKDGYAFLGGVLFIACGWIALAYISEVEKNK